MKNIAGLTFNFTGKTILEHEANFKIDIMNDLKRLNSTPSLLRVMASCHHSSLKFDVDINDILKDKKILEIAMTSNRKIFIDWIVSQLNFEKSRKETNETTFDAFELLASAMISGLTYEQFSKMRFIDIIRLMNKINKVRTGVRKEVKKATPEMMKNWFGG